MSNIVSNILRNKEFETKLNNKKYSDSQLGDVSITHNMSFSPDAEYSFKKDTKKEEKTIWEIAKHKTSTYRRTR